MYRTRIVNKSIIDCIRCLEMKPARPGTGHFFNQLFFDIYTGPEIYATFMSRPAQGRCQPEDCVNPWFLKSCVTTYVSIVGTRTLFASGKLIEAHNTGASPSCSGPFARLTQLSNNATFKLRISSVRNAQFFHS
jgi:hypothetical protein